MFRPIRVSSSTRGRRSRVIAKIDWRAPDNSSKHSGQPDAEYVKKISVDTKKKQLAGDFDNAGREWRPKGAPEAVRVHDFVIPELGRAVPYGVYDIASDAGWVSVGVDQATAAFAVNAIRSWWKLMRRAIYQQSADYRRWRRQQRLTRAVVESRAAKTRRSTRH